MSENEKLRFTDGEIADEITETTEETAEPPIIRRKQVYVSDDDAPIDVENPVDVADIPAVESDGEVDGGGEIVPDGKIADTDYSADGVSDVGGETVDTPVKPKLYERESSMRFTRDKPVAPVPKKKEPVKKRQRVFGIMADTTSHDNLINKPLVSDKPAEKTNGDGQAVVAPADEPAADNADGDETPDAVSSDNASVDGVSNNADAPAQTPAPTNTAVNPISTATASASSAVTSPAVVPAAKPAKLVKPVRPKKSKLKFSKDEKPKTKEEKAQFKEKKQALKQDNKIGELQYQTDLNAYKRDKAKSKQPTTKKKIKERFYDESKNKVKTKIHFEETPVPINEAKWNVPKKQSLPVKGAAAVTMLGVNKVHSKVYEVEGDNVGTQAAHKAELVGESAYRGGKKLIHSTYRHVKNTPYRQAAKFETKTVKSQMKLDYQKALKDNPQLKSNPMSRFMQKRKIKRQYAETLRQAKKSGETVKKTGETLQKTGSVVTRAAKAITNAIRKNPVFMLKAGLLLLIIIAIMSLLTMCLSIFSGGSGVLGFASYSAADEDIEQAELSYTEWETDLQLEILNAETTHSGYDEYRYNIGTIGHDPHELMAFLTAVYQDFTYSDVESVLQGIFAEQYTLEFIPEIEIRQRWEQVGVEPVIVGYDPVIVGYDPVSGNPIINYYPVYDYVPVYDWVDYEWHILNVKLTSVSFTGIIAPLMNDEQTEQYLILMQTKGARQYVSSPFAFNWLPYVTSNYGYRVHPITGVKDLHRGIDIALPEGTEILAGIDGTVTTAAYNSSYGNYIVISDGNGLEVKYAHCHTLLLAVGQTVAKGDVIATVGTTGSSTGNHLHMEIVKDGLYLNPAYFAEPFY